MSDESELPRILDISKKAVKLARLMGWKKERTGIWSHERHWFGPDGHVHSSLPYKFKHAIIEAGEHN